MSDARLAPYIAAQSASNLKKSFPHRSTSKANFANALAAVRALRAAGVPLLAGTDAPNRGTAHGANIHCELELLVQAGLRPTEALRSATSIPAKTFALDPGGASRPACAQISSW